VRTAGLRSRCHSFTPDRNTSARSWANFSTGWASDRIQVLVRLRTVGHHARMVEAFVDFQIPRHELGEYPAINTEQKKKVLGLNRRQDVRHTVQPELQLVAAASGRI